MMCGDVTCTFPGKEIIEKINAVYPLTQVTQNGEAKSDTAQRYRFSDSGNEVGRHPLRE